MQAKIVSSVDSKFLNYIATIRMYYWLVYDKAPTGTVPTAGAIFDSFLNTEPVTWTASRDVCHRFVVKKTWSVQLSTNGLDPSKAYTTPAAPAKQVDRQTKFFKKLGVTTEWKNTREGGIGDIKEGALYIVGAPSYGFTVNVNARFRVYFKSVGYQ